MEESRDISAWKENYLTDENERKEFEDKEKAISPDRLEYKMLSNGQLTPVEGQHTKVEIKDLEEFYNNILEDEEPQEDEKQSNAKPGILSQISLTHTEQKLLSKYLSISNPGFDHEFLELLLKDSFLKFYDIFAGQRISVPSRKRLIDLIMQIKIYNYVANRGFTTEAYERARHIFRRKLVSIHAVCNKIITDFKKAEEKGR